MTVTYTLKQQLQSLGWFDHGVCPTCNNATRDFEKNKHRIKISTTRELWNILGTSGICKASGTTEETLLASISSI